VASTDTFTRAFVKQLSDVIPEASEVVAEHVNYYGELLPHLVFGDLTRWIIDAYRRSRGGGSGSQEAATMLKRILEVLEWAYASNSTHASVRDTIGASFLENLHQAGADYDGLKSMLGSSLRRQLDLSD
jgi:hypothetical protein